MAVELRCLSIKKNETKTRKKILQKKYKPHTSSRSMAVESRCLTNSLSTTVFPFRPGGPCAPGGPTEPSVPRNKKEIKIKKYQKIHTAQSR